MFKKAKKIRRDLLRSINNYIVLSSLNKQKNIHSKLFYNCIKALKDNNDWTEDEHKQFNVISDIRSAYKNSCESVMVTDFGAVNPGDFRSEEEMLTGIKVKRDISSVYETASTPDYWGHLIFKLIREFKPATCMELGTCLGISASYQIAALKLNNAGTLITLEGSPELARLADASLKQLDYHNYSIKVGRFSDTLPVLLEEIKKIDFAFIDGHHDKSATRKYFDLIYPCLNNKAIIIFDDINWDKGMQEVWSEIKDDKRIQITFDLQKWGICYIDKKDTDTGIRQYKIFL